MFADYSITYSAGLGYIAGLAIGCVGMLIRDEFDVNGSEEVSLRLFISMYAPGETSCNLLFVVAYALAAVIGCVIGGLYNELMHGAPWPVAILKIIAALALGSTATFALIGVINAIDASFERSIGIPNR